MKLSVALFQISSALFCTLVAQAAILPRQGKTTTPDNTVVVAGTDNFCLVVPKAVHTNVGDSEYPGGETVYCSAKAKTSPLQGDLAPNFWSNVDKECNNTLLKNANF
ncbi:hypothetical protein K443DRAFT_11400 [Laccaria amethystina LaAM-08-1]|uniref:Uncharacterized protein n=1 Tax=Laccaria amethystina LaAM-08-1 TaxID=1095629 RepID=A0A0C9WJX1_9AGAR|nr:hypothetical protein K443DRAFT_11400 [Laccaria amethystina LaAM-08-1]